MRTLIGLLLVTLAVRVLPGAHKRAVFAFTSSDMVARLER